MGSEMCIRDSFHYPDIHSFRKNTLDLVRLKFFITQNYAGQKSHYADLRRTYVHYAEDLPRKSYIFQYGNRGLIVAEVLIKYFILGIYHNRPYILLRHTHITQLSLLVFATVRLFFVALLFRNSLCYVFRPTEYLVVSLHYLSYGLYY